jgi:uncharacterized membrane protein
VNARQSSATAPHHEMDPVERMVRRVLTVGIVVAVVLMATGLVLSVADSRSLPSFVVPIGRLPSRLVAFDPSAYLSLGLLALIATPFVRVAGSLVAFAIERDRRYVAVTAVVLAVMSVGVLLGRA